jgi:hypothetical protein
MCIPQNEDSPSVSITVGLPYSSSFAVFFEATKDKLYKIENICIEQTDIDIDFQCCYITSDQGYKIRVYIYENKYKILKTFWYYIPFTKKNSYKRGKLISKNNYFVKATELDIDMINYNL